MAADKKIHGSESALSSPSQNSSLLAASSKMRESLKVLKEINQKANIIALNATIEGARTRGRLDAFSIVAEQIHTQASRNGELSDQLELWVSKLQNVALRSTAARYYELAEDLIDKLDRNLFERNCDVQAWATFEAITRCALEGKNLTGEAEIKAFQGSSEVKNAATLLERLIGIYCVYDEVFLLNKQGVIIAAAKRQELTGRSFAKAEWFRVPMEGKVHVSDMSFSDAIGKHSVYYSAPVMGADGGIMGVLSTRFNWKYAQEMIDSGSYDANVRSYVLNKQGLVLAATDQIGIVRDSMDWLDAGLFSMKGFCGYTVECDRNGAPIAVGFARTKGFNAYRGKAWSALISARLGKVDFEHLQNKVDLRADGQVSAPKANGSEETKIQSEVVNEELQTTMTRINELVSQINTTNTETNMLAINAAIQAGIAGTEGESFSVIAAEIGQMAEKSVEFVESVNATARDLQGAVEDAVAVRLSDAARDAIDKVDRNLFERFCDVQAWTTFQQIIHAAESGVEDASACELLARLHQIYEVYHEIMLLDLNGKVVATGSKRELIGQNQSNRTWFQEAIHGKVHVTEVYRSHSVNATTMSFSAPVLGREGKPIGVLTTRFNWNVINDLLGTVIVDSRSKVYLADSEGRVIGTPKNDGSSDKSFGTSRAHAELGRARAGCIKEVDPEDQREYSIGFSRSTGYNTYSGKHWSVIIRRPTETRTSADESLATVTPLPLKRAA